MSDDREQKNAIFAQQVPAGVDPRMPRVSQAEKMKSEFGFEIPQEVVPLPSNGKVYSQNSTLYGSEVVEIRSMFRRRVSAWVRTTPVTVSVS